MQLYDSEDLIEYIRVYKKFKEENKEVIEKLNYFHSNLRAFPISKDERESIIVDELYEPSENIVDNKSLDDISEILWTSPTKIVCTIVRPQNRPSWLRPPTEDDKRRFMESLDKFNEHLKSEEWKKEYEMFISGNFANLS